MGHERMGLSGMAPRPWAGFMQSVFCRRRFGWKKSDESAGCRREGSLVIENRSPH